jgi:hypothetical protein
MHSPGALFRPDMGGSGGSNGSSASGSGAGSSSTSQQSGPKSPPSPPGNLFLSLQQDYGRWATEYTYSAKDGMFGLRGLWNFGLSEEMIRPCALEEYPTGQPLSIATRAASLSNTNSLDDNMETLVDQENSTENGLRGRFSAGGEIYFSVKQRSLGREFGSRVGNPGTTDVSRMFEQCPRAYGLRLSRARPRTHMYTLPLRPR